MPRDKWSDYEDVEYIYTMQYYVVIKNEKQFTTTYAERENVMMTEVSQKKDKLRMLSLIYNI